MTAQELKNYRIAWGWSVDYALTQFPKYSKQQWYNFEAGRTPIPEFIEWFAKLKTPEGVPAQASIPNRITSSHLKVFRRTMNLTQRQAATLCKITQATWSRYESGVSEIPASLVIILRRSVKQKTSN